MGATTHNAVKFLSIESSECYRPMNNMLFTELFHHVAQLWLCVKPKALGGWWALCLENK
jgi:hypothetical protein